MKKVWRYEGKRYVIYDDMEGNYYLNGHPYHCMDILHQFGCEDKSVVRLAKQRAKEIVDEIESKKEAQNIVVSKPEKRTGKIGLSDVVFLGQEEKKRINMYLFRFESKQWTYEKKQYIVHNDAETNNVYLNGNQVINCLDIWHNVDSPDEMTSWRAKHKAKEIEVARLEMSGLKIDRAEMPEYESSLLEKIGNGLVFIIGIAFVIGILYFIYWIWWGMIGEWAFEGPFADDTSAGEVTFKTIIFFIAFIVIIEEAIRRIRNGHF